jgi:muconolactone D-isomerase
VKAVPVARLGVRQTFIAPIEAHLAPILKPFNNRLACAVEMEWLVEITLNLPVDLAEERRAELQRAELARGTALAEAGTIRAIWRVPGRRANLGIWSARDATALHAALVSLPLWPYLEAKATPLASHPLTGACQGWSPLELISE